MRGPRGPPPISLLPSHVGPCKPLHSGFPGFRQARAQSACPYSPPPKGGLQIRRLGASSTGEFEGESYVGSMKSINEKVVLNNPVPTVSLKRCPSAVLAGLCAWDGPIQTLLLLSSTRDNTPERARRASFL